MSNNSSRQRPVVGTQGASRFAAVGDRRVGIIKGEMPSAGDRPIRLLALMKYGDRAASTRQRLLQYRSALRASGIVVDFVPLLDNAYIENLARPGANRGRWRIISAYLRRFHQLLDVEPWDVIWLYSEGFPYLPGFMERLVFRSGKPVVYDFDDAFFHQYDAHRNPIVRAALGRKLEPLLRGVSASFCGNAYLKAYADRFCDNTVLLPTVVDAEIYRPIPNKKNGDLLTIGWIGSPSTWTHLRPVMPLLSRLSETENFRIRVVGAGHVEERFAGVDFVDWTEQTEVSEIQRMDIGIMPLPDEPWARGKCGYKLIQYMACALPVIASPVGVNRDIVEHGANGFLAASEQEWKIALSTLLGDAGLRQRMGRAGRAKVEADYSLAVHAPRLIEVLKSIVS